MTRGARRALQIAVPVGLAVGLFFAFPWAARFVEGAALSLRRFWWVVAALALGGWLVWTLSKRNDG